MTAHECFNEFVRQVFWAMRDELKEDRFENDVSEAEQHWADTKDAIRQDFGVSQAYMKSISKLGRRVSLDDYVRVVHWVESLVSEEDRPKVRSLVDSLLGI